MQKAEMAKAIGVSELQMRQILAYRIELFDMSFLIAKLDALRDSGISSDRDMLQELKLLVGEE